MWLIDIFKQKDNTIKDISKTIHELKEVQNDIITFTNDTQLDKDIADMIGQLKGQDPENISGEKLVEFLVYLSDKTKTKTDSIQSHYADTMRRVIHAKIDILLIYHMNILNNSVISQLFSFRTIVPIIFLVTFLLGTLMLVHRYDRELFVDIGVSNHKKDTIKKIDPSKGKE